MFELGDFSEVAPHGKFKAFLDFFSFLLYVAIISCRWSINMFFQRIKLKVHSWHKKLNHATKIFLR